MKATGGSGGGGSGSSAAAAVDSSATCGLCFEPYVERGEHVPLIVPCGHTYCSSCLSSLPAPKKCPSCHTPLGNAPVSSLPHNFALLELLAAMPPPAPPLLEKRSLSGMTDEEVAEYLEQRRVQKVKFKEQAATLTAQKQEVEAQRHVVLEEAVELDARIETSKQACVKQLDVYNALKAGLDELEAQALAKQQQEQGLAQQVASLEVQIDDLLNYIQPQAQMAAQNSTAKVSPKTYAVRISGATGNVAGYVNGLYEVTDEVSGGMPVYKKQGGDMWLEYHVSNRMWMSRRTTHKGQAITLCTAYVYCAFGVLPDNAPRGAWHAVVNGVHVAQASVVLTPVSASVAAETAAVQAACGAARAAATYNVRISGATGDLAHRVNGLYEVVIEVSGGMPVYKREGDERWLEYHVSTSRWMSRRTTHKGQANDLCEAYIACAIGVLPDKAPRGAWRVIANDAFQVQASVVVTNVPSRFYFDVFVTALFVLLLFFLSSYC